MKEITSDLNNLEVKSLHKVEVSLHVNIEISEDKKVTLGNISTAIKGLGIESKIAEQIIQTIDEKEVEKLCGNKYQRGNGENQILAQHFSNYLEFDQLFQYTGNLETLDKTVALIFQNKILIGLRYTSLNALLSSYEVSFMVI